MQYFELIMSTEYINLKLQRKKGERSREGEKGAPRSMIVRNAQVNYATTLCVSHTVSAWAHLLIRVTRRVFLTLI